MTDLIPKAFQYPENPDWSLQADELQNMVDDMAMIGRLWPLIKLTMMLSPSLRDVLRGFVYEVDGQAVGMANLMTRGKSGRWIIGNVAVLPSHRRQGLARKLVEACIAYAQQRKASVILLDVIAGNVPAYELYRKLGFEDFQVSVELTMSGVAAPVTVPPLPAGYVLEPLGRFDWQDRYALARRITPSSVQAFDPVKIDQFKAPVAIQPIALIMSRFGGSRSKSFAVRQQASGQVVAVIRYAARVKAGGINDLNIRLDPAHAPLAPLLVSFLLDKLRAISADRRIEVGVDRWQAAVVTALCDAGFSVRHEMYRMGLRV
jgi:ribosomal protein S18 acetylase RimI-like enzyme